MPQSQRRIDARPPQNPRTAPVAFEPLEPRALFSTAATAGVVDPGTTTATDSTVVTVTTTDTHTSNGKGANGYPHGKFGFW